MKLSPKFYLSYLVAFMLIGSSTLSSHGQQNSTPPPAPQKADPSSIPNPRLIILPENPNPAIHGARIVGATPGNPFLFTIPATGTAPLSYSAANLPEGLKVDEKTGIISGALAKAGTTQVILTVSGPGGNATRELTVVGGDHPLELTPAMGWDSWNAYGNSVDEAKIRQTAHAFISQGLIAHGYQYVNMDQGWEGKRDAQGNITSNDLFPNMKGLCDDVHGLGLKIGLYSAPGPQTCGPYAGSYQHEEQDAQTYAQWGFDYLKYDWCAYEDVVHGDHSVATVEKPYRIMGDALIKTNRDIVFTLCVALADPWVWGSKPDIHGSSRRIYTDVDDRWTGSVNGGEPRGVYDIIQKMVGLEKYAGPGSWNNPDNLVVGNVSQLGDGATHPAHLTPNEEIVHISMWCLFAAPLIISSDVTKLDSFTRAILTNDEAIAVDQDPLGKAAARIATMPSGAEVWSRALSDGTRAVGLLNTATTDQSITVKWSDVDLSGRQPVRDLWLHRDVGVFDGSYSVLVPSRGIVLLKIGTPGGKQ